MTEKRFEERYEGERIVSVKDNINDKNINIKEMVDLLNELNEENMKIKSLLFKKNRTIKYVMNGRK